MKLKRRILSFLLVLCFCLAVPTTARAADETEIIRQMINYFRHHQEAAEADISRLLEELESISPEKAARWEAIMDSWLWTETELNLRSSILLDGLPDDNSLCIVVLGYELTPLGQMQQELRGRVQVALEAARKYPNAYVMVTGGATAATNKTVTEAGRMAAHLMENGISEDRIIQETKSYSTEANAINCMQILSRDYPQIKHLVLITSDYHIQYGYVLFAAQQQLNHGGSSDLVGAACYSTGRNSGFGYATQAAALAEIAGVHIATMKKPTLSQITGLAVLGDTVYTLGEPLDLSVSAVYDSGMIRDVTEAAEFSGYDPSLLGMQTVTVTYAENGITTTGETSVLVQEKDEYIPLPSVPMTEPTPETQPAEPEPEETVEASPYWWILLLFPAACGLYELRQYQLRKRRRRQRRRRKMNLE